jgi:hypothetical protein
LQQSDETSAFVARTRKEKHWQTSKGSQKKIGMKDSQEKQPREGQRCLQWLWERRDILSLPENLCKSELTYEAIMDYFEQHRPAEVQIQKGVVLREKLAEGVRILQMFLDEDNLPVYAPNGRLYGRRLLAQALSQQLNNLFGKNDVISLDQGLYCKNF